MAPKFKAGDQVELKSGGPTMTVDRLSTDSEHVTCNWFTGKKIEEHIFNQDSLKPAKLHTEK